MTSFKRSDGKEAGVASFQSEDMELFTGADLILDLDGLRVLSRRAHDGNSATLRVSAASTLLSSCPLC